jgi:hypothetical protein
MVSVVVDVGGGGGGGWRFRPSLGWLFCPKCRFCNHIPKKVEVTHLGTPGVLGEPVLRVRAL